MKLYRHLAWDGIRKNSRLYVPYLLTGVGAVSFFYILVALARLPEGTLPGSGSVQVILNLGSFVLWVFSLLLLFYTHSFLIRRRNREFALYNVLGMGKGDIARILCWETLLSGGISLAGGLALGILLGKLAELGLMRVMGLEADMTYRVSAGGLLMALGLYGAIYLLILLSALLRVRRSGTYRVRPQEASRGESASSRARRSSSCAARRWGRSRPGPIGPWRCWAFCCWGRPTTWLCPSGSL